MAKGRGGECTSEQEQRIPKKECSPGETGCDYQERNLRLVSGGGLERGRRSRVLRAGPLALNSVRLNSLWG